MSTKHRFTYTVVGFSTNQWFAIATDLKRDESIGLIRTWVYGAVRHTYSHPDTAALEMQPWWVKSTRVNTDPPKSLSEYQYLSPWVVSSIRHVDGRSELQVDDPRRIVETWMVGPDLYHDSEWERTFYGWCGLKLRSGFPAAPMDTWPCMLIDEKVYSTASARFLKVENSPLFSRCVPINQKVHDISYGAEHVRRRLR